MWNEYWEDEIGQSEDGVKSPKGSLLLLKLEDEGSDSRSASI
jgi:hypothetical protein